MQEYEIEFYDKADGSEPAKEFILALDAKMRAKVVRTVGLLREEGPSLREPYSKHLEDGIFEIRTKFGSDITRTRRGARAERYHGLRGPSRQRWRGAGAPQRSARSHPSG